MRPRHVAIIPDGNRRWAAKHRVSMLKAYETGIDNIGNVLKWCRKYKVTTLTMWGFSTENFLRDKGEVRSLFSLFDKKLAEGMKEEYRKHRVRVRFLGRISSLPHQVQDKMRKVEADTSRHKDYSLNLLLAYGGRQEILDAVNSALLRKMGSVDEKTFPRLLYLQESPDLVIRTSGEMRTSGFLPWQSSYSEYHFSKKLWPEFSEKDFRKALTDYSSRRRKYGR